VSTPQQARPDDFFDHFSLAVPSFRNVLVLDAFFDDTEIQNGPRVFAVAGILFSRCGLKQFTDEWGSRIADLKGPYRTSHCFARRGAFQGWSEVERDIFLADLARLIAETRDAGFTATIADRDYEEFRSKNPSLCKIAGSPFTVALTECIDSVRDYLGKDYPGEDVYFWFESGTRHEKEAKEFIRRMDENPKTKAFFKMRGHSFIDKRDAVALCAADFLAWEWQRNYAEGERDLADGKEYSPWRDNFKLLFKDKNSKPIRTNNLGPHGLSIRGLLNGINQLYRD
jgi:hypothetical protein